MQYHRSCVSMPLSHRRIRAFSLVELSVVLVIIGLVLGGVLLGQNMSRAAELRGITDDIERLRAATNNFAHKYDSLPGDFNKATQFWGALSAVDDVTCQNTASNNTTGTKTCNGNGDGTVNKISNWNYIEMKAFFQHMSNAGVIDGKFYMTGTGAAPGGYGNKLPSSPRGKLEGSVYYFITSTSTTIEQAGYARAFLFAAPNKGIFLMGSMDNPMGGGGAPVGAIIKPQEAWGIDNKYDDGMPGVGMIQSPKATAGAAPGCASSDVAASATYTTTDNLLCPLVFIYE